MSKFNTHQNEKKMKQIIIAQNRRFWSYRLHKLGTPKLWWTDRQSRPNTRPDFAKAMQVKNGVYHFYTFPKCTASSIRFYLG